MSSRSFVSVACPAALMGSQDWEGYKINIVAPVLDYLNEHEDGIGPLHQVLQETLSYQDGDHLLWMTDGKVRKQEAERCLKRLRQLVANRDAAVRTDEEERLARQRKAEEDQRQSAFLRPVGGVFTLDFCLIFRLLISRGALLFGNDPLRLVHYL